MTAANDFQLEFKQDIATDIVTSPKMAIVSGEKQIVMGFNPQMCLLTLLFKVLAIVLYFVMKFAWNKQIGTFVVVVIATTLDFWVTKNLTGRKLVGLRWWSEFNQQGQEQWVFQSCQPNRVLCEANSNIFWISQFLIVAFWAVISLLNIATLDMFWTSLALFGFLLSSINLYCYFKCRGQHHRKITELAERVGIKFLSS